MNIRPLRADDQSAVRQLNLEAFGGAAEADLIERLRADADVVFELVAEADGAVIGHILFSRLWTDSEHLYAALAPMAVAPGHQGSGAGSALVRTALELCKEYGARGVLVLGHVDYYPRFGFAAEATAQVKAPYSGLPGFMGLAIEDDAFAEPLLVAYPSAFSEL